MKRVARVKLSTDTMIVAVALVSCPIIMVSIPFVTVKLVSRIAV